MNGLDPKIIAQVKLIEPQATDEEIAAVWQEIQAKDPNITPDQVIQILPALLEQIKGKMAPQGGVPNQSSKLQTLAGMGNIIR